MRVRHARKEASKVSETDTEAKLPMLAKWSGWLVAPLPVIYMTIILYEVVARYVWGAPTIWASEVSTFLFGAQFMLGGALCYASGNMVRVDVLRPVVGERVWAIFNVLLLPVAMAMLCVMIWYSGLIALRSISIMEKSSSILGAPIYILRAIIPVSAALMLYCVAVDWFGNLRKLWQGPANV
jgi:TRAP-type C4-dicarboxylate transport system permease small subunit